MAAPSSGTALSSREDSQVAQDSPRLGVRGRVLIVAYHFPPQAGSSGLLRSLKFCRYLPEFGWAPTVLTIDPRAYVRTDGSQMGEIPPEVNVIRAFGLDSQRHLSLGGRYLRSSALPDRWVTWLAGAIPAGLSSIRKQNIDVIFTTYPIASAVLIGYFLHVLSGKPWIVDFRDSMTEEGCPQDPLTRRIYQWIEGKAIQHGSRFIFTAPAAVRMYLERYPALKPDQCLLLPNGYDEADFEGLVPQHSVRDRIRLLHSGLIYPWERDPQRILPCAGPTEEERVRSVRKRFRLTSGPAAQKLSFKRTLKSSGFRTWFTSCPLFPTALLCRTLPMRNAFCSCRPPAATIRFRRKPTNTSA